MDSLATFIGSFMNGISAAISGVLSNAQHATNVLGLFAAGLVTVAIITGTLIGYIKQTQVETFNTSYNDDPFIRGKTGALMAVLTVACGIWFLFSIVYIYFISS